MAIFGEKWGGGHEFCHRPRTYKQATLDRNGGVRAEYRGEWLYKQGVSWEVRR